MAVGEERRGHMEVPNLENLSDELHNCFLVLSFLLLFFLVSKHFLRK